VTTSDGNDLGLHWTASTTEEHGNACIYLTVDDLPQSGQACGDPSSPQVSALQLSNGAGVYLFGIVPKTMDLEWELTRAGGSIGAGTHVESNPSGSSPIPFLIAIPETEGHLTLRFIGLEGGKVFPDWEQDLVGLPPATSP
jgi:hypothetical protein